MSDRNDNIIISFKNIRKEFRMHGNTVHALKDISLDIFEREYLSVMGPSGSGKTTLFNMIGALDRPTSGNMIIGGTDLARLSGLELAFFRNNYIGYIFQSFNLIPSLTALKNVALPILFRGIVRRDADDMAAETLKSVGLGDRLHHRPDELSGGQQQRVAIARALANEPVIILADEPTGNLDLHTGEQIIGLLSDLSDSHGVTVIAATHDHKMLASSDRILWIKDGSMDRLQRREDLDIRTGRVG